MRLLECEEATIAGRRILGCTWWSALDWLEHGEFQERVLFPSDADYVSHAAALGINAFRLIRNWSVDTDVAKHQASSAWLSSSLAASAEPPIVVTIEKRSYSVVLLRDFPLVLFS